LAVAALLALIALGSGIWWSQGREAASDAPAQPPSPNAAAALSPIRSLAVLPLDNLSGDPEQEFFADGMTETLIAELAKLPGVRVISRTSVMQFKGKDTPLPEILKTLNVDGVIEGSVMRAGDQVRITAQLIDARSDHHVWAEQYDRELARVLEIQREVARAVAAEIQVALTPQQVARFSVPKPVNPRAQDAYFRAVMHSEKLSPEGFGSAIEEVGRAIALEPEWAPPRALLARAVGALVYPWRSFPAAAQLPRARREALRAVALDPDLAEAHAALALTYMLEWEWLASEQEFERARALGDSEQVLTDYALLLSSTGRCDEAVRIRDAAVALAPASVSARANRALYLFWCDRFAEALKAADEIAAVDPGSLGVLYARWRVHELSGNWVEALESLRRIAALQPVFAQEVEINERAYRADGAAGYWRHRAESNARLGRIDEAAAGYASLGDADRAFAQLESGFAAKDPQLTVLLYSPYLKPLRSDPRFADLARRMGLPAPQP
jgi:TolB-like protein/tetratricopeptide (TPR) repeat protein